MKQQQNNTILIPMMLEPHFTLIKNALAQEGYQLEILSNRSESVIESGLSYVHNDMCYPALLVIGQMIDALRSGKYDPAHTSLILPQTGGGCRASNYVYLLRKALKRSGFEQVKVLSINATSMDDNTLYLSPRALLRCITAVLYGDFIYCLYNQARSYEEIKGNAQRVREDCVAFLSGKNFRGSFGKNLQGIFNRFLQIPLKKEQKPRVGIVGEIYLKYSPLGNNDLEDFLIAHHAEPVVSGLMDFILYCMTNSLVDTRLYDKKNRLAPAIKMAVHYLIQKQKQMIKVIRQSNCFLPPHSFDFLCDSTKDVVDIGTKMGEGWLLGAEVSAHIRHGVKNIVCAQPFGCLPNHIAAKGIMANVRTKHPDANVIAVDYDAGACQTNQENRLNLMLMNAKKNMEPLLAL